LYDFTVCCCSVSFGLRVEIDAVVVFHLVSGWK